MRRALILTIVAGLVALAGCSSGTSTKASSDGPQKTNTVDLPKSYRFAPASIEVAVGSTVTWTNSDNFVHNVHLLDGSNTTKPLSIGGKASITFDKAGTYAYQCSLHPAQMKGTVVVTA
jgi:plastocyanin